MKKDIKKSILDILNPKYFRLTDWLLILSNIFVIFYSVKENLSVTTIMWIYWYQGIIIGFFTIFKIISLKKFTTRGLRINNKKVEETTKGKINTIIAFIISYAIFHIVYFFFITVMSKGNMDVFKLNIIFIPLIIFIINHAISFITNYKIDQNKNKNIGELIMFPILRIFPMHLTILFGAALLDLFGMNLVVLIFFQFLKTILDLYMHKIEHHI